jgi:DNA-binding NarL/FixJ family response regulator
MLLEGQDSWVVCGEASDGTEAVASALRLRPDIIVMDVAMPRMNGLQAAERISKVLPGTRVLLFTLNASQHLVKGQENVIRGIVSKQNAAADLPKAVDAVLHGKTYFAIEALNRRVN